MILASCKLANTLALVKYLFTNPSVTPSVVPAAFATADTFALIVPVIQSISIVGSPAVKAVLALAFVKYRLVVPSGTSSVFVIVKPPDMFPGAQTLPLHMHMWTLYFIIYNQY